MSHKKGTAIWHLYQMARADELALAAKIRGMQYAGFETGRHAQQRFEHWQEQARGHFAALEQLLLAAPK